MKLLHPGTDRLRLRGRCSRMLCVTFTASSASRLASVRLRRPAPCSPRSPLRPRETTGPAANCRSRSGRHYIRQRPPFWKEVFDRLRCGRMRLSSLPRGPLFSAVSRPDSGQRFSHQDLRQAYTVNLVCSNKSLYPAQLLDRYGQPAHSRRRLLLFSWDHY